MKFILLFLLCINLYADHNKENHIYKHINKELSHLRLSDAQHEQIKIVLKQFREDLKEYRIFKDKIKYQKENIFLQKNFDIEKSNELSLQLDTKAHDIENKLLKAFNQILDDEQKQRFINYFDDWEVK